ncbi:MAG: hypothetical protein QN123_10105 [Armatimonadota bacterium]|nr:hypothetical protein [Armatimonadota bacterium]
MTDEDLATINVQARGDAVFLPHYEEPRWIGAPGEYPLVVCD